MDGRVAFFFPGQGSYLPGVFANIAERTPGMDEVLESVDAVSVEYWGERVSPLLFDTSAPRVEVLLDEKPAMVNLAMFATSIAAQRLVVDLGARPDVIIGHSFGELSASVAADMLTVEDAARVACERDKVLREMPPPRGGMVALEINVRRAEGLVSYVDDWTLDIAVDNGPQQTVISGTDKSLGVVARAAAALGIEAMRLPVRYPYHNRLLQHLGEEFSERVGDLRVRPPRCPVYSPIFGGYQQDPDYVHRMVLSHFTLPVRFREGLHRLYADGVRTFVSCGARELLDRIVTANLPAGVTVLTPFAARADMNKVKAQVASITQAKPTTDVAATSAPVTAQPGNALGTDATAAPSSGPGNGASPGGESEVSAQNATTAATPTVPRTATPAANATATPNGHAAAGASEPAGGLPPRAELVAILRTEYAETLGYPEDVLTDDADLEADLGIDSIKQVETFARMRKRFNLPEPPDDLQPTAYTTLPAVADLLHRLASGQDVIAGHS